VNPDFKELLIFNVQDVDEYLIVGAHALAAHGHVGATKDLDIWVRPDRDNAQEVLKARSDFGARLAISFDHEQEIGRTFARPRDVEKLENAGRRA